MKRHNLVTYRMSFTVLMHDALIGWLIADEAATVGLANIWQRPRFGLDPYDWISEQDDLMERNFQRLVAKDFIL